MRRVVLLGVLVALGGCDSDGGDAWLGDPPTIAGLRVTPDTIEVGQQVRLEGTLSFEDPDGDVAFISLELRPEGGIPQQDDVTVAGAEGITVGQVPFMLLVQAVQPGPIELGVWLIDGEGNESNELTAELLAQ